MTIKLENIIHGLRIHLDVAPLILLKNVYIIRFIFCNPLYDTAFFIINASLTLFICTFTLIIYITLDVSIRVFIPILWNSRLFLIMSVRDEKM